jgi:hypothetical protein
LNRFRENSPQTSSTRKMLPLPGPSPLSLKRSASFGNQESIDRPRKRRTRSSDVMLKKKVSSLLEQAQSFFRNNERSSSPQTEAEFGQVGANINSEDYALHTELELAETEVESGPLTSDNPDVEMQDTTANELKSDELFDTDFDLQPEDFEALDISSHVPNVSAQESVQSTSVEEDALFGDGYDDLIDLDFDEIGPEVFHPETRLT